MAGQRQFYVRLCWVTPVWKLWPGTGHQMGVRLRKLHWASFPGLMRPDEKGFYQVFLIIYFSLYSLCQFPNLCPSVWIIKKSRWYSQCFLQQLSTQLSRIKNLSSHIYTKYHILCFLILFYLVISKAELSNIFGNFWPKPYVIKINVDSCFSKIPNVLIILSN